MKTRLIDNEIPKHRKKVGRKVYTVRWDYHGDISHHAPKYRLWASGRSQKYDTLRAAKQSAEDWSRGRGIYGSLHGGADWTAKVIGPDGKQIGEVYRNDSTP